MDATLTKVVLLFTVWIVPRICFSNAETECTPSPGSVCGDECYLKRPPANIYLNQGDNYTVEVQPNFSYSFFVHYKDSKSVNLGNKDMICDPNYCVFDLDAPRLEILNFDSSVVGDYEIRFLGSCTLLYSISQAVAPTLTKENNKEFLELDEDAGSLNLSPTINHGLPPGEVVWYKDGINISTGDSFSIDIVFASDRGIYSARIENIAGNATLDYQVRIRFVSMISLTTIPADTSPESTTGPITVICKAKTYPGPDPVSLTRQGTTASQPTTTNFRVDTLDYEAEVMYTYEVSGCPVEQFRCAVGNGLITRHAYETICQKTPNITSLSVVEQQSTNVSVQLSWTLDIPTGISYKIQYREDDSFTWNNRTVDPTDDTSHTLDGLSPGTKYEFRVRPVRSNGDGTYSSVVLFTTFTAPLTEPTGLVVSRNSTNGIYFTWQQASNTPSYAPVTSYDVLYYSSADSTPQLSSLSDGETSFTLTLDDASVNYSFSVRARNRWGTSEYSSVVESPAGVNDPFPLDIAVDLSVEISDDEVVLSWSVQNTTRETILYYDVKISRVVSRGPQTATFYLVYSWNTTNLTGNQCFNELNSSETYQICIQPVLASGRVVRGICRFIITSTRDVRLTTRTGSCLPVVNSQSITNNEVIPSWAIAVIVVGAVLLVFVFFGGCGLFFGLRRNQRGELDYEGHNETFDKYPNDHGGMIVNGNYPYPPPPPRSASPPRSCMSSYRHNHHGHQMDWQGVTAV